MTDFTPFPKNRSASLNEYCKNQGVECALSLPSVLGSRLRAQAFTSVSQRATRLAGRAYSASVERFRRHPCIPEPNYPFLAVMVNQGVECSSSLPNILDSHHRPWQYRPALAPVRYCAEPRCHVSAFRLARGIFPLRLPLYISAKSRVHHRRKASASASTRVMTPVHRCIISASAPAKLVTNVHRSNCLGHTCPYLRLFESSFSSFVHYFIVTFCQIYFLLLSSNRA